MPDDITISIDGVEIKTQPGKMALKASVALFRSQPMTALRSASLSLVCQPFPSRRKCARISASSRSVTFSLTGAFCLPRARWYSATICGTTSLAGRARAQSSSVHSGASGSRAISRCASASSSSVRMYISRSLFVIRHPLHSARGTETDDARPVSPLGKHDVIQAAIDKPESRPPGFTGSRAGDNNCGVPNKTLHSVKAGSPHFNVGLALRFVPFVFRVFIVLTICLSVQERRLGLSSSAKVTQTGLGSRHA